MISGPSCRSMEMQEVYDRHMNTRGDACDFCNIDKQTVLSQKALFWVINNLFPYALWDDIPVADHLLMVPKQHIEAIGEFNDDERKEFFELVDEYEQDGYSIYARAPRNQAKSVIHQHTHLIKIDETKPPINHKLYVRTPHVMIWE